MSELRQRRPTGRNEEEEESSGRQNTDGKVGSGSDTKDHAGRGVRKWILVFGIAASCAVFAGCLYASTLTAEFIFDDHGAIVQNEDVWHSTGLLSTLPAILEHDFWGTPMNISAHKSYRPLTTLSFRLSYVVGGNRLDSWHFHAFNVALHTANVALLVIVAAVCVFPAEWGNSPLWSTGLLFAAHPVHAEAVSGLVGRADLLCTLLCLLSLLVYSHAVPGRDARQSGILLSLSRASAFVLSLLLVVLATASKELGLAQLGVLAAWDVMRGGLNPLAVLLPKAAVADPTSQDGNRRRGLLFGFRLAVMVGVGISVLVARVRIMHGSPHFTAHNNAAAFVGDRWLRWLSYWHIYSLNLWLLLWPNTLCCDWSMGSIPLITALHDPRNLPSLLLFLLLFLLLLLAIRASLHHFRGQVSTVVTTGVVAAVVPFIPASNLFFPVGFVLAERVLYLPSVGFCLLVAALLHLLEGADVESVFWQRGAALRRWCSVAMLGGIVVAYSMRLVARNADWKTSERMFESGVRANPRNAKLFYNLAHVTCDKVVEQAQGQQTKRLKRCAKLYREATRLAPDFAEAWGAYGSLIVDTQQAKGLELMQKAVDLDPHSKICQKNLGDTLVSPPSPLFCSARMTLSSCQMMHGRARAEMGRLVLSAPGEEAD